MNRDRRCNVNDYSYHLFITIFLFFHIQSSNHLINAETAKNLASKTKRTSTISVIPKVQGGSNYGNNHIYELNPNYVNSNSKALTLGDLENESYLYSKKSSSNAYTNINNDHERNQVAPTSVGQIIQSYYQGLYKTSPSLAIGAVTSIFIFIMWQLTPNIVPLSLLRNHFVCSLANFYEKRLLTLFLAAFSHVSFSHLILNLYMYCTMGPSIANELRSSSLPLWPILFGASIFGSFLHMLFQNLRLNNIYHDGGYVGLSGVTCSFLSIFSLLHPYTVMTIRPPWPLWMILPSNFGGLSLPSIQLLKVFTYFTLLSMLLIIVNDRSGVSGQRHIAHATHLGGLIFGKLYVDLYHQGYLHRLANWFEMRRIWKIIVEIRKKMGV